MSPAPNLVEVVQTNAREHPTDIAYIYLVDGDDQEEKVTFAGLDLRARAVAAGLQKRTEPGDRVLLLYPSGIDFICAFLGCLYAGVIAVPSVVPHPRRDTPRLHRILLDSGAKCACAPSQVLSRIEGLSDEYPEFGGLRWLAHEDFSGENPQAWRRSEPQPDRLAFLQYTSGSTSAPKGSMISHANLFNNIQAMRLVTAFDENSTMVMWLPLFHDMGLVYGVLTPLCAGRLSVFMSPVAFLERPSRWLRALHRYKGTHSAAPNFAYDLCAEKISADEKSGLDLSAWRYAANASEPVRLETMRRFSVAFGEQGFLPDSFSPAYGLAESTAMVTAKYTPTAERVPFSFCTLDPEALERSELVFLPEGTPGGYPSVGCGSPEADTDIRIVDPQTRLECTPDRVGEIWVMSSSVAQGYWGNAAETEHAFGARLADSQSGAYMRTGDMGFFHNSQLHVAGRIKDMIIVQGRNLYPQDIELTAESSHAAFRSGCSAACAVDDGRSERLVIVQEVRREYRRSPDFTEMANALRMAVARQHGLRVAAVVLIPPSSIHKTTSGKIQRSRNQEAFLRGEFGVLYEWRAPDFQHAAPPELR